MEHARRRLFHGNAERLGNMRLNGPPSGFAIELHPSAEEVIRLEVAQHQIGVGAGRQLAAAAVARWPRLGTGALWTHAEQAAIVDPADRSTAGADGVNV